MFRGQTSVHKEIHFTAQNCAFDSGANGHGFGLIVACKNVCCSFEFL